MVWIFSIILKILSAIYDFEKPIQEVYYYTLLKRIKSIFKVEITWKSFEFPPPFFVKKLNKVIFICIFQYLQNVFIFEQSH